MRISSASTRRVPADGVAQHHECRRQLEPRLDRQPGQGAGQNRQEALRSGDRRLRIVPAAVTEIDPGAERKRQRKPGMFLEPVLLGGAARAQQVGVGGGPGPLVRCEEGGLRERQQPRIVCLEALGGDDRTAEDRRCVIVAEQGTRCPCQEEAVRPPGIVPRQLLERPVRVGDHRLGAACAECRAHERDRGAGAGVASAPAGGHGEAALRLGQAPRVRVQAGRNHRCLSISCELIGAEVGEPLLHCGRPAAIVLGQRRRPEDPRKISLVAGRMGMAQRTARVAVTLEPAGGVVMKLRDQLRLLREELLPEAVP